MNAKRSLATAEGFTLIEIMIAVVITSIGLLALGGLQVSLIRANALSQRMTAAISVAEQKLEQVKNAPYANIQSESATQIQLPDLDLTFTRQVTVTDNSPLTNTKTVNVTVTWLDGLKTYTIPFRTIIAGP
jgi:prepilin-type N-terminal cleavage/methylation domain-containing protein